ncbi:hypothetical protein KJ912_02085, partial [Patescibacteria group bacterium]|nr:hypothetical protein [Patescibacteria group bacterium]
GATFIPIFYYRFVLIFLNLFRKDRLKLYFTYLLGLAFVVFNLLSDAFVSGIGPKMSFKFWPDAGFLYPAFLFMFFGLAAYSTFILIKSFQKSTGTKRQQIKFIILGMIVGFIGGATNYLLWFDIKIPPVGNILVSFYVFSISYAIIRHRLLDIRVVIRQGSVFIASIITVITAVLGIRFAVLGYVIKEYILLDFFTLVLAVSIFPFIRKFYYTLANHYFFTSLYDPKEVISQISEELSTTLETQKVFKMINQSITTTFRTEKFGILIFNNDKDYYRVGFNQGFKIGKQKHFLGDTALRENFIKKNQVIILEEIIRNQSTSNKEIIKLLQRLKVELIAPLNIGEKTLGLLVLGPKETQDPYTADDLLVIDVIRSQAAIAIQNALSYKEIKDFSRKLEREVKKATRELRTANTKLKKLDKAKSEFISIASHQLRTPLTSIKGFTSLLLEEAYGRLPEEPKKIMKKIYISNERLILLVEDLLNISRIERGKMEYVLEPVNLRELLKNSISTLMLHAQHKDLFLKFQDKTKKHSNILINADYKKIAEVFDNLIDNAVKYTQKGGITVTLEQKNATKAIISVSDTGIGIKPQDLPRLFEKFTRGEGVSTVNTGGTGLGLFIVKKLTEAHKGKVWVTSPGSNKGATFYIELPLFRKNGFNNSNGAGKNNQARKLVSIAAANSKNQPPLASSGDLGDIGAPVLPSQSRGSKTKAQTQKKKNKKK